MNLLRRVAWFGHRRSSRPVGRTRRRTVATILVLFALTSVTSVGLSAIATSHAQHRVAVLLVADRQRMLAERYVTDVLLVADGRSADPRSTARAMRRSALALLSGGEVPAIDGDDDGRTIPGSDDLLVRKQLRQQIRLIDDLVATGEAILNDKPTFVLKSTAGERALPADPQTRLRVLGAATSNVSLNAARTIAADSDAQLRTLVRLQVLLGALGMLGSLLLGWLLIMTIRRQTAHFRSLVHSSTDLVAILDGSGDCRYVSPSVVTLVGPIDFALTGSGFRSLVHPLDAPLLVDLAASVDCDVAPMRFRLRGRSGWRQLEATVTDLRHDRQVRGIVLNSRDITERMALEEQLNHQAFHDPLTGLANRVLFRDRLQHALAKSARGESTVAVIIADLDDFKQVNDTLGHELGDRLLATIAGRLEGMTRTGDTVARLGGDEFAIILENTDEMTAREVAQRVVTETSVPVHLEGHEFVLGASVGVAIARVPVTTGEDLARHADVAMYAAKHAGRNRYEVFHPELARQAGELLGLQHEIQAGISNGEFVMYYQPVVSLKGSELLGVEALMRWQSPTRGLIGPMAFIPGAESSAAIMALGEFALHAACLQTAQWQAKGLLPEGFTTWVNLSAVQLTRGGICCTVEAALAEAGLPPHLLGVELTETALVVEDVGVDSARLELEQLHALGVRIAIDDFGTGFSSLSHLTRFPVDALKIDRSFVTGIELHGRNAVIGGNIINLAHALGLVAIAEGIETAEQLAELQRLGCDVGQGFLFARPTPASETTTLLAARVATVPQQPEGGRSVVPA
ncbi:MAG: EAL domain-containing protein [Mycobacteriales bacterium]